MPKKPLSPIAAAIVRRAKLRGMTQADLGRAPGLNYSTIKSIFQGSSHAPRGDTLRAIADALGCSVAELVAEAPVESLPETASDGSVELAAPADRYEARNRDPAALCRMILSCIDLERWAEALQWNARLRSRLVEIRQEQAGDLRERQGV